MKSLSGAGLATDAVGQRKSEAWVNFAPAPAGIEAVGDTLEQFAAFMKSDRELGAPKVRISGAQLDWKYPDLRGRQECPVDS